MDLHAFLPYNTLLWRCRAGTRDGQKQALAVICILIAWMLMQLCSSVLL